MFKYKLKECPENLGINRACINGVLLFKGKWLESESIIKALDSFKERLDIEDTNNPKIAEEQVQEIMPQIIEPINLEIPTPKKKGRKKKLKEEENNAQPNLI